MRLKDNLCYSKDLCCTVGKGEYAGLLAGSEGHDPGTTLLSVACVGGDCHPGGVPGVLFLPLHGLLHFIRTQRR